MRISLRLAAPILILPLVLAGSFVAHAAALPTQLSNLEVTSISAPTSTAGNAVDYVIGARRTESICPALPNQLHCLGLRVADYQITVTQNTSVLNVDRKPLTTSIQVGDHINAYGPLDGIRMTAQIVRDLDVSSAPAMSISVTSGWAQLRQGNRYSVKLAVHGGTAPYTWQAFDLPAGMTLDAPGPIYCIKAPCPQPAADTARIVGVPTTPGSVSTVITVQDSTGKRLRLTIPFTVRAKTAR